MQKYTHLLIEAKSKYSPNIKAFAHTHVVLDSVETFSQVAMNYKLFPPIKIKTKPALFILERKDFRDHPRGHNIQKIASSLISEESNQESTEEVSFIPNENDEINQKDEDIKPVPVIEDEDLAEEKITSVADDKKTIVEDDITDVDDDIPVDNIKLTIDLKERKTIPDENMPIFKENDSPFHNTEPKPPKAKKALDELRSLRQERKKKAIAKIKSETRKEVVASAKEKLRDIMKRHKNIAEELSENLSANVKSDIGNEDKDGRGDIPPTIEEEDNAEDDFKPIFHDPVFSIPETYQTDTIDLKQDDILVTEISDTNENMDAIVEEVIIRLLDRKIYDDKTKPEDIKAEDRQIIQKIVEEVLMERMNYSKSEQK